jgi:hypothetical protein
MIHMMNEARISVGNGAAALDHAGYRCVLDNPGPAHHTTGMPTENSVDPKCLTKMSEHR